MTHLYGIGLIAGLLVVWAIVDINSLLIVAILFHLFGNVPGPKRYKPGRWQRHQDF